MPSCASRDAVVGRLQNVLPAEAALCVAVLPAPPDATWELSPAEACQRAEQRFDGTGAGLNLAQVKAELSYLNSLDERRETNVASLKRLKEARDALLGGGSEVARISSSRKF